MKPEELHEDEPSPENIVVPEKEGPSESSQLERKKHEKKEKELDDVKKEELENPTKIDELKKKIEEYPEEITLDKKHENSIMQVGDKIMKDSEIKDSAGFLGELKDTPKKVWDEISGKNKKRKENFKRYVEYMHQVDLMDKEDVKMMEEENLDPETYREVKKYIKEARLEKDKREHPEDYDEQGNFIPQKVSFWGMIKKTFTGK